MSDTFNPDRRSHHTLPALALTRAGGNSKPAHASVYLLADHLDVLLGACEDIVEKRLTWNRGLRAEPQEISAEKHDLRDSVEDIRKLENTIILRALKSRERAEEVARVDKRFRQLAKLYVAGTAVLVDAVAECNDSTDVDFATADSIPAYLRSRGLVAPDAPAPTIGENIAVGEDFLIAKRIAAGPLMDLAATLLDALELHYDLFLDENEEAMAPQVNRFEDIEERAAHDDTSETADEIGALIEDVRDELASEQSNYDPNIWGRLSATATATASTTVIKETTLTDDSEPTGEANPSIDEAEAENELALSPDQDTTFDEKSALSDDAEDNDTASAEVDEDDVPTEIIALETSPASDALEFEALQPETGEEQLEGQAAKDNEGAQDERAEVSEAQHSVSAHVDPEDIPVSSKARDPDAQETEANEDVDDDNTSISEAADVKVLAAANEDDGDADFETSPSITETEDEDDGLIISAANDDEEDLSEVSASDDGPDSDDRPVEAATEDDDTTTNTLKAEASEDASEPAEGDTASDAETRKKPKSLLSRLSLIRS